ncbi:MAG: Ca-activated chloride channel [Solirubrobacteraceae bacterium]|nr:Ca-activated chloride channel [Solirubrobacteraceae bacterium]
MSFGEPLLLLGLVLVPLAVLAYLQSERRRRVAAAAFAAPAVAGSVAPRQPGFRRHVPLVICALALAVLILALAKPQTTVAVDVERASIMLVFDNSGSMQATDVAPSRLLAARAAADKFLGEVPSRIRVGLVAFNQAARTLATPTTDQAAVRAEVDALAPSGGTATGEALDTALSALQSQTDASGARLPAAVILLSDGKSTSGRDPVLIAQRAKRLRIPVYTVALGTPTGTIDVKTKSGATITRPVPPDPDSLRQISTISRGQAFAAADQGDLSAVYQKLGSRLGKKHEKREITAGFAGGAFGLLAAAGILSLHWFRRLV